MPPAATSTWNAANVLLPAFPEPKTLEAEVAIGASLTLAKGTVLGELTATPGTYKAYASGNGDGSQVPKGLLKYSVTTDASGNITLAGEFGQTYKSCPMYTRGSFKTQDLTGLDANAVTVLGAHLIEGTTTTGIIELP